MDLPSSEVRKASAFETSPGSIQLTGRACRPSSTPAVSAADGSARSGRNSRYVAQFIVISVLTAPGASALTRIEYGASSSASVFISPMTPHLAAM
jgi:hypothetical protein